MAEHTGKNLYMSLGGTVLSAYQRKLDINEPGESVDATSGTARYSYDLPTFVRGSATIELVDAGTVTNGGTTAWAALAPGQQALQFIYAPEGTATGQEKHTVNVMTNSRSKSIPYADVVIITGELRYQGAPTDSTW
jgi:hypothetical protein